MGIRRLKPTSPGTRFRSVQTEMGLTDIKPLKSLTHGKKRISGRNNIGNIAMRRRGGGHKRRYRIIDFKRNKDGIPAKVAAIEYDPNRSAYIARLHYLHQHPNLNLVMLQDSQYQLNMLQMTYLQYKLYRK